MRLRSSFVSKVRLSFAAAVFVVAILSLATWIVARDAADAARAVEHTHTVIHDLDSVRHNSLVIEFATQGFRISGDATHLAARNAAIAERETTLVHLRRFTQDNPQQQERWRQLREVLNQRLAISQRIEQLLKTQGRAAADAYVATAPLAPTRERTYRLIDEMKAEELRLLAVRDARHEKARNTMVVTGALVSCLLLVLLAVTYGLIRRQLRETEASQRSLARGQRA